MQRNSKPISPSNWSANILQEMNRANWLIPTSDAVELPSTQCPNLSFIPSSLIAMRKEDFFPKKSNSINGAMDSLKNEDEYLELGSEVLKLSEGNFFRRKAWQKRFLVINNAGLGYYHTQAEATRAKIQQQQQQQSSKKISLEDSRKGFIAWNEILRFAKDHEEKNFIIIVTTQEKEKRFAFASQKEANAWLASMATFTLVDLITNTIADSSTPRPNHQNPSSSFNSSLLENLIDSCGANVDGNNEKHPLVLKAIELGNLVACDLLLRRGGNAR